MARISREAGALVKTDVLLRHLNLPIEAADQRQLEVIVDGLPCFNGAQLATDFTHRSSIATTGALRARAAWGDGVVARFGAN